MIKELFVKNLLALRSKSGMTQAGLAAAAGIAHRYYVKIEHGESWPSPENMDAIAKALGANPSALFIDGSTESDSLMSIISALPSMNDGELRAVLGLIESAPSQLTSRAKTK